VLHADLEMLVNVGGMGTHGCAISLSLRERRLPADDYRATDGRRGF
jgi:hypothetical protein